MTGGEIVEGCRGPTWEWILGPSRNPMGHSWRTFGGLSRGVPGNLSGNEHHFLWGRAAQEEGGAEEGNATREVWE